MIKKALWLLALVVISAPTFGFHAKHNEGIMCWDGDCYHFKMCGDMSGRQYEKEPASFHWALRCKVMHYIPKGGVVDKDMKRALEKAKKLWN